MIEKEFFRVPYSVVRWFLLLFAREEATIKSSADGPFGLREYLAADSGKRREDNNYQELSRGSRSKVDSHEPSLAEGITNG